MAKQNKNKAKAAKQKAYRLQAAATFASPLPATAAQDGEDAELGIDPEDLEIAVNVLSTLVDEPEALTNQRYKKLKSAGWDLAKVLQEQGAAAGHAGVSIHSKISHLLSLSLYRQALVHLFDIYINKTPTKLGSLQRWVRECDATSRPGKTLTAGEEEERNIVLKCLDMVLRVCGGGEQSISEKLVEDLEEKDGKKGVVRRMKVWNVRDELDVSGAQKLQDEMPLWDLIQKGFEADTKSTVPSFYAIQKTPGHLRRPPNVYDSTVFASTTPSPIPFPVCARPAFAVSHPAIPSLKMLANILPPSTCERIISTANTLGWEADQAAGGSAVDKTSVLAHNVVWLADEDFVGELFDRIKPFVQEQVGGGKVRAINRRFRVYRYGPKQVYRPHIDGAWPAAGVDKDTGEYLHDSSPENDPLWSRFTLLIYLNSDINNTAAAPSVPGATTFFLPSPDSIGTLLSFRIAPVQGAVLVFPHGDARGSLLHEGSPVGDGGWKVVIRTDLLYEAEGFGEFAPGKSKKRKLVSGGGAGDGITKIAKIVSEDAAGHAEQMGEVIVPVAVGAQHAGDGVEGIGG
ncbi:hypothetical protein NliqN6_2520 [Naganishia liquefaciens]|uniref:Prolyl 4-hydroxylase alpha subunit domain-containing protein n=1 Tax=Naganishia liquefaciens TaxID=104408 RepID=A0A8H3TSJ9_9TREE|nr:hypothetical protein NliqN6_2520 [Naganishia liquefaciens]